ncbi:electron transport complex protein RnfG [Syntrophus gentianae]|uniref:Electron transport complex protein RnfG n=1 Tax=Syntrophus gentianae TaxID=43775 RepID=A0A1H7VSZ2_9BACT|nr:FMN-binding protein [Syntrophus gentianae]SEM11888.1 electron transport complex protein RnfG [Syntrophus gentianae]
MNEIIRITFRLTLSCFLAALVMGGAFVFTDKAKKENEHKEVQSTMLSLLGYSIQNPAPKDLKLYSLYRYIIEEKGTSYLGYMVPVANGGKESYELLKLSLEGKLVQRLPLNVSPEKAAEETERKAALKEALKTDQGISYQDSTVVARKGDKKVAYMLSGKFGGFKTFIKVIVSLSPEFDVRGLEIMEHEEDPGLGAEISQNYFKNQFRNKSFDRLKTLNVVKEPLPEDYRRYLDAPDKSSGEQLDAILKQYRDKDIYALTGATISSRCVTDGVKNMVKRFAYRIKILDEAIASQKIPALI